MTWFTDLSPCTLLNSWQSLFVSNLSKYSGHRTGKGQFSFQCQRKAMPKNVKLLYNHKKLWKIIKEMGILDHLTCLLRNLYAGQEAIVRAGRITTDGFKIGKDNVKAVHCHPAHLTCAEYSMWNTRLGSRLLGEISITSDIQMTVPLRQKVNRN